LLAILALVLASPVFGQPAASAAAPAGGSGSEGWSFSAEAFAYFVPQDDDLVMPIVSADRGSLHLEARYNYEELDTASVWGGWTFGGGTKLEWEITPIAGVVLGELDGVAVGYEGSLRWRSLELYSESEYVFDTSGSEGSFFYNWSELTVAPAEWIRLGLVAQRTRVYESDREVNPGLLVGVSYRSAYATAYVLNPDDDPTVIISLGLEF
jgi:hypothetical protein